MKTLGMSLTILAMLAVASASASVYDYTTSGMDSSDWSVVTGGTWMGWQSTTVGPDSVRSTYAWVTDGAGNTAKLGYAWSAPVGEAITSITFSYLYNANVSQYTPVVYTMDIADTALSSSTPIAWTAPTTGYISGTTTLSFTEADNVQKFAVGLTVPAYGYNGWFAQFSDVTITTVPEPATLALLSLGGVCFARRK